MHFFFNELFLMKIAIFKKKQDFVLQIRHLSRRGLSCSKTKEEVTKRVSPGRNDENSTKFIQSNKSF